MVEIIAFPGKTQSTTVDTSRLNLEGRLNLEDNLSRHAGQVMPVPQISSTLDGTVVVNTSEAAEDFPVGDWTNQELADLYRVESLLVQAGIKMSTGRGVTDENDPWFVFCRDDGDVFVHLARADGRYLLDSPGLSGLLEGPDFATLIDTFVKQLAALRANDDESNVVSFRPKMLRDKSVHLHPSILLAALIWTLYLASDDIASATEAASDLAEDMILPVDKLLAMDEGDTAGADIETADIDGTAPDLAPAKTTVATQTTQSGVSFADTDRSGSDRLVSSFSSMIASASPAAQAVSASLAIIAFSFGFYGPQAGKDTDSDTSNGFSIAGLNSALRELADSVATSGRAHLDQFAANIELDGDTGPVVLENLEAPVTSIAGDVVDFELHLKDLAAEAAVNALPNLDVPVEEAAAQATVSDHASESASSTAEDSEEPQAASGKQASTKQDTKDTQSSQVQTKTNSGTDTDGGSGDALYLAAVQLNSGSTYSVGSTTALTTLDEDEFQEFAGFLKDWGSKDSGDDLVASVHPGLNDTVISVPDLEISGSDISTGANTSDMAARPQVSAVNAEIGEMTMLADIFVNHVIKKMASVEVVFFNTGSSTELVLFDKTAIDDHTSDNAHARSWVNDDGMVISVVGHYQDFADYGLA
ncbi:hypothetical protein [Roseibium alexandrii]|uniref:Uncharacterized protein n=1 Tax=Roseibium alexandrii (strain DSM 17067 / NCIMB 14079 / DFL-11) TaxID=244592 RepID=A0A5E8H7J5_ROSAD|nr:hypothetical protein [Roseibium alexandrii]EEE48052.1 hypothetical protein SADFL11_113 [Roseibium alexandrii DFL-11]